jgi:RND family efflux transporter MFP subunit
MRHALNSPASWVLLMGCGVVLAGCTKPPPEVPPAAPPSVPVSYPVEQQVTDYADFTARTAAVDSVEVRARVWGFLKKVNFKEGALVKQGEVLFELDPRPYDAERARCLASLKAAEANRTRTLADFKRAGELLPKQAIAQSDYDLAKANYDGAAAAVNVAEAMLNTAELNLSFTKVTAPVSGRVSRYLVTVGNLVQSGDQANCTLLTTIVSVDPMYAYFDVDDRTALQIRQLNRQGKAGSTDEVAMPASLGLANEDGFPHQGTIDFVDNQINARTGTQRFRGTFANKDDVLLPGLFARVRMPVNKPHAALLVSDRAIDTDQGQKIVYVVDKKDEVTCRPIRVGSLHDGLREIVDGLKPGERVIVNGLQLVRPGMKVQTLVVTMPRSRSRSEDRPGPTRISASH